MSTAGAGRSRWTASACAAHADRTAAGFSSCPPSATAVGITLASREISAKTNEIPEFAPLLDQIDDADLAGTVVTADAPPAPRDHATYLHERGTHYLLTIKNNQRGQARRTPRSALEEDPRDSPRRRPGPRPPRTTTRAGRHRRRPALPARRPSPAHPTPPSLWSEEVVQRDRPRHHRPAAEQARAAEIAS
ncbi:transposase [Streptomyces sp. NPDC050211]|uniref:transposase n=1 Tax=Streptomyces sp. NPDC050211 TaxID=3154932 RepID=UPI00342B4119